MDRTAKEIVFTETGCNFCDVAMANKPELGWAVRLFKDVRTKNKYDVLIGLSGGVDSSRALDLLVKNKIRPLCYSIDNGWQTDEANENIMRLVEGLKVPFYRENIDIPKFLDLQGAFMKAGLINAEIPSDHLLLASSYKMAAKYGIKTIISGGNWATESIMPASWSYLARDLRHIKDVYKKMTGKRLKGLPVCGLWKFNYYKWIKRIRVINLLDYFDYNREESIKILEDKYGYKPYGEKHEESVFTHWYQSYYLFEKFNIDKRKAHFSSLILSGQMTREDALAKTHNAPVYPELGLEQKVMRYPKRSHHEFKTDEKLWTYITTLIRALRSLYRRLTRTGKATKA